MTTAIIQFIGLLLFSYQFTPGQNHLQALAPRITSGPLGRGNIGATTIADPAVGEHATFITFAREDYVSNTGWEPKELTTMPGLLYVRLDGEQVEFKGAASKGAASKGGRLAPTATIEPKAADGLKLPHLATCCKENGRDAQSPTLRKEFRPPFSGAAAVFDLRAGRVQNCNGVIDGVATSRVDTVVQLDTNTTLTIFATLRGKGAKQIELRGGAHVLVANLPIDAITGGKAIETSSPHFTAYYAMMEKGPNCAADFHCAMSTSSPTGPCESSAFRQTGQTTGRTRGRQAAGRLTAYASDLQVVDVNNPLPPLEAYLRIDFECSNSQWP